MLTQLKRLSLVACLFGCSFASWRWHVYLASPQRVVRHLVAAVESNNVDALLALIMGRERQKLRVNGDVVHRVLKATLDSKDRPVQGFSSSTARWDDYVADNWYRAHLGWKRRATGERLRLNGMEVVTVVELFYNEPLRRWEVSFTRFASDFITVNISKRRQVALKGLDRTRHFRKLRLALLAKWGISEVFPSPPTVLRNGQRVALLGEAQYDPLEPRTWTVQKHETQPGP